MVAPTRSQNSIYVIWSAVCNCEIGTSIHPSEVSILSSYRHEQSNTPTRRRSTYPIYDAINNGSSLLCRSAKHAISPLCCLPVEGITQASPAEGITQAVAPCLSQSPGEHRLLSEPSGPWPRSCCRSSFFRFFEARQSMLLRSRAPRWRQTPITYLHYFFRSIHFRRKVAGVRAAVIGSSFKVRFPNHQRTAEHENKDSVSLHFFCGLEHHKVTEPLIFQGHAHLPWRKIYDFEWPRSLIASEVYEAPCALHTLAFPKSAPATVLQCLRWISVLFQMGNRNSCVRLIITLL